MDIEIYSKDIILNNKEEIKVIRVEITNNSITETSIKSLNLVDDKNKILTNAKFFYKIDTKLSKEANYQNLCWFLSENLKLRVLKPKEMFFFDLEYHSTTIAISQIIKNPNNQIIIPVNILIVTKDNEPLIKKAKITVPS